MLTTAGAASATAAASPASTTRAIAGAPGQTAAPIAIARTINLYICISIVVADLYEHCGRSDGEKHCNTIVMIGKHPPAAQLLFPTSVSGSDP
jgi:hypothetical protein